MATFLDTHALQRVGTVQGLHERKNDRSWHNYLQTDKEPFAWTELSRFKDACNKETENLAVAVHEYYGHKSYFGWLAANFVSEFEGPGFEVYQCKTQSKLSTSSSN